ncbi:ABC transporter permease [Oenococcus sicerae]|uniref:ABC transporter permease n=1 Tax=Oenococcus sicerae TaxID=2203724 RepID=A0AAJ1RA11_9LACO|nr:ABC transporter permease [Oenococcus sicerae]MDN6900858.1 ABC transporter permease [Oenococcus sicerae]
MNDVFQHRRQISFRRNFRYLSRAFNDQFIGFLFIAVTLLGYEYIHSLSTVKNGYWLILPLLIISVFGLFFGDLTTYLQTADQVFLIANFPDLKRQLKYSLFRSLLFSFAIQTMLNIILLPMMLKVSGWWFAFCYYLFSLFVKLLLLILKYNKMVQKQKINWPYAINLELRRVNRINLFFNFFTDVKEIKHDNRPTRIWDFVLNKLQRYNKSYHWILFTRYFFRSRQFMSTMIATTILGMLLTASLPSLVAATIAAIFILFAIAYQLKPIFSHYAQHRIARIYPQDSEKQLADFQLLATKIFSPIVLLLLICLLFGHQSTAVSISFLIIGLAAWLIVKGYLPRLVGFKYEIKK